MIRCFDHRHNMEPTRGNQWFWTWSLQNIRWCDARFKSKTYTICIQGVTEKSEFILSGNRTYRLQNKGLTKNKRK
jgi:hypothetical protein